MASLTGNVGVEVDGDEYTLRFGGAALLALEESFGKPWAEVLNGFGKAASEGKALPMKDVASIVRCALLRNHPDLTLEDAAELAVLPEVQTALGDAISAAFPAATEAGAGADQNPPRRRGTGTRR